MASTTYARIQSGIVAELFTTDGDITTLFNPELVWVSVGTSGAQVGWAYASGVFSSPPVPVPTGAQLIAYANVKQWSLATEGYTTTISGTTITFPTDVVSMGLITGKAARLAQPNPPASFAWQTPNGFVTIAATDFITAATQIADFVQSTFDALQSAFAGILDGTITTTAQVDALSWPA